MKLKLTRKGTQVVMDCIGEFPDLNVVDFMCKGRYVDGYSSTSVDITPMAFCKYNDRAWFSSDNVGIHRYNTIEEAKESMEITALIFKELKRVSGKE